MALFNFGKSIPQSKIDYSEYYELAKKGSKEYEILQVGKLIVTSGKIVTCDPLAYIWNVEEFNKEINPGNYSVEILIAKNSIMSERYAFAKVEIANDKVAKWELALTKSQIKEIKKLKLDEFFGFPVDAGMGCFCDLESQQKAVALLDNFLNENEGANIYDDYFAEMLKKNAKNQDDPNDCGDWLNFQIPNSNNNIIMFQSGFGDGLYPTYWGLNKKNEIVAIVIDFLIIENGV